MAFQISNPIVVSKVERLAKCTGLSKTAAVERAVNRLFAELSIATGQIPRMAALLSQLDSIPDCSDVAGPLAWDELGLPT